MAPAILQLDGHFELVAAASRDAQRAAEFAAKFDCDPVAGYQQLIDRSDIEALYVPLPTGLHPKWVSAAVRAGKHVYVEKSFAPSLHDTETLLALAETHEVAVMEGYMFLYHRQMAIVRDLLASGQLGELRHFHGSFGFPPLPATDFRYDDEIGGGVLMDAAGYPLRAALDLLGSHLKVEAASVRKPPGSSTLWGSAFLSDRDGLGASIAFGFDNFYQCRMEIWGSRGKLSADRLYTAGPTLFPRLTLEIAGGTQHIDVEPDNHFFAALLEFASVIRDPSRRAAHRNQIHVQSRNLHEIRERTLPKQWHEKHQ